MTDDLEFFIDRSLGRKVVPEALRAPGLIVHTMASLDGERAAQSLKDEVWLADVGRRNFVVLMKDDAIRRWSALAWLVALAVAVLYSLAWLEERQPPEQQGDSQPGLVARVGVVAVLVSVTAAGLGRLVRRRGGHGG